MANYESAARSSYFRVKDEQAFRALFEDHGIEVVGSNQDDSVGEDGCVALLCVGDGGWSNDYGPDEDQDIVSIVAPHLADGWVAVFVEAGHEKLRYCSGFAVAVNGKGETRQVSLNDIYPLAAQLGENVTDASY